MEEHSADHPVELELEDTFGGPGLVIGRLLGFDDSQHPLVTFPGAPAEGLSAVTTVPLRPALVGRQLALMFEQGLRSRPVVMGLIQPPAAQEVTIDGEKLVFEADREVIIRCGKASITLTRAGKVLIRGEYVLSRSAGTHRIQGGSVQIN